MKQCESCGQQRLNTATALVNGRYYKVVCAHCLGDYGDEVSSNAAGYDRRRGYEDNAQDTIQPYDAAGPSSEFLRLYPTQARKIFSPEIIEELKKKI